MAVAAGILIAMPVTIAELEAVAARGWRAPEEAPLGGWLLRAAEGFTGRANSALAVGDPGMPLADALTGVCDWYAARGLPPMIAVPHPRWAARVTATWTGSSATAAGAYGPARRS
jgi:hypothetical protein